MHLKAYIVCFPRYHGVLKRINRGFECEICGWCGGLNDIKSSRESVISCPICKSDFIRIPSEQSLLTFYELVQAEITRYRDIEWRNVILFTGAIATIIAFALTNNHVMELTKYRLLFEIALVLLVLGNIFYSMYAHKRLTDNRLLRNKVEYLLNLDHLRAKNTDEESSNEFRRGLKSHLLPFFTASTLLAAFGYWFLENGDETSFIVYSWLALVLLVLIVMLNKYLVGIKSITGNDIAYTLLSWVFIILLLLIKVMSNQAP